MSKVFISFAEPDREWAKGLARDLVANGNSVVFDQDAPVATNWAEWIKRSLADSSKIVAILSYSSAQNANMHWELGVATALGKPVIMVDTTGGAATVLANNWIRDNVTVVDGRGDLLRAVSRVREAVV